jgi:flagellar hook-associated protein FlgK
MNFAIGLSSLRASQFAIDTVSQNLANANTEGYHRQEVIFEDRDSQYIRGNFLGNGVDINSVRRMRNQVIESSYTNSISDLNQAQQSGAVNRQIESLFLPGEGSIHKTLGGFFDELTRLSSNPSETVQRNAVIQKGVSFANQARTVSDRLTSLKTNVRQQIEIEVDVLNGEIKQLVELQNRIKVNSVHGALPNDLYDQRDQLINRIAEKIDVQRYESTQDGFGLTIANSAISIGSVPIEFETDLDSNGAIAIKFKSTDQEVKFSSGSIVSLTEAHNFTIDQYREDINELVQSLMRRVDQAHASGVGIAGPYNVLRSTRRIDATDVPLNDAGLAFPVSAGELFVSVTAPDGNQRTYAIQIDPTVDSLEDVANRFSNVANVQAVVDNQNGQLSVIANPGFRFDFTGNLDTVPGLANYTGTATPAITGEYTGDLNRKLAVLMVGSGTIGKTEPLIAQVTDSLTGKIIAEVNIGDGYEAGTELPITEGVSLVFPGGNVVDGDSFETQLVANSDTTGILSALGLNSFFSGHDATDIAVSQRIINNPGQLATSRSGDLADTTNLLGMMETRESQIVGSQRLTFEDYLNETSSKIGFRVQTDNYVEQNVSELNFQIESEIAAVSGVDLNEEMLGLAQYQKQYEAAVQVMRVIDEMMAELFGLVR